MAREDIEIDTEYGELPIASSSRQLLSFSIVREDDNFVYCEVAVPARTTEIVCEIAYAPIDKALRVRLRRERDEDLILNPTNNSEWYDLLLPNGDTIHYCNLRTINSEEIYNLVVDGGTLRLYSGAQSDVAVTASLSQNQTFLLKASAGTLYNHPLTGVGLIDFLHCNLENNGLAQKLQKEFEGDNMVIINAYMDSITGDLLLEVNEKNNG